VVTWFLCAVCCLVRRAALAVSVFHAFPQQRTSLSDEVLTTVVDNMHVSGKAPPRQFEATGACLQPLPVMMATALLVQLVQVRAATSVLSGICQRPCRLQLQSAAS
jgi:hypothetical protein